MSAGIGQASGDRFSVIVPTWNEERWLPLLLGKIDGDPSVSEIIVADHSSTDDTAKIALDFNCRLVAGGLPAVGRNAGARAAAEEIFLFIDADVSVTSEILDSLRKEFSTSDTMLVYFRMIPISDRLYIRAAYKAADVYARLTGLLGTSQGSAPLICVRRSAFVAVGGFDEAVGAAEDVDFIHRVGRQVGGVRYVRATSLYVSARRFDIEDRFRYSLKCVIWGLLRGLGFRTSLIPYTWKQYSA
jgi:glycosyltransferase involved in cell wall biosynthesis